MKNETKEEVEVERIKNEPLAEFDKLLTVYLGHFRDFIQDGFYAENKKINKEQDKILTDFLRSALNAQREEIREKIKAIRDTCIDFSDICLVNKILALLSPNNKDL